MILVLNLRSENITPIVNTILKFKWVKKCILDLIVDSYFIYLYLLYIYFGIEIVKVLISIGHIWCIENEEKILAAEQENLKTLGAMKKTITSEDILSTLPSSRYFDLFLKKTVMIRHNRFRVVLFC